MNAEQSDILLNFIEDAASGFDYFNFPLRKSAAQLKAEMEAMRQPITAQALARSWHCIYHSRDDYYELLKEKDDGIITVAELRLFRSAPIDLHVRGLWIQTHAQNMYDLGELVRLLGGAA